MLSQVECHVTMLTGPCMAVNAPGTMSGMKLYADGPIRRTGQLLGDLLLVLWVLLWLWLADVVHDATMALAAPGRTIEEAGGGLAGQLRDAGSAVGDVPLVGDEVRTPFDGAGRAADQIAEAGAAQVEAVEQLAFWLGITVAAIPVLIVLATYLPLRWRFVREASAGQRFIDEDADLELFALRAMANQPMHRLAGVTRDPVRAWRDRDADVVRALALLELRDVGLTPPRAG